MTRLLVLFDESSRPEDSAVVGGSRLADDGAVVGAVVGADDCRCVVAQQK